MSSSSASVSAVGSISRSTERASSTRPFIMYQRGVSGSRSSATVISAPGIAAAPSINRQFPLSASPQAIR